MNHSMKYLKSFVSILPALTIFLVLGFGSIAIGQTKVPVHAPPPVKPLTPPIILDKPLNPELRPPPPITLEPLTQRAPAAPRNGAGGPSPGEAQPDADSDASPSPSPPEAPTPARIRDSPSSLSASGASTPAPSASTSESTSQSTSSPWMWILLGGAAVVVVVIVAAGKRSGKS